MKLQTIFKTNTTTEGIPFFNLNKSVHFPEDKTLDIYGTMYLTEDTHWTVLSYTLYKTIEHWWVLASINGKNSPLFAKAGTEIVFVRPELITQVLSIISEQLNATNAS